MARCDAVAHGGLVEDCEVFDVFMTSGSNGDEARGDLIARVVWNEKTGARRVMFFGGVGTEGRSKEQ